VKLGNLPAEDIVPEADLYVKEFDRAMLTYNYREVFVKKQPIVVLAKSYLYGHLIFDCVVDVQYGSGEHTKLFFKDKPIGIEVNYMIKVTKYRSNGPCLQVESYTLLN
jgi:hypothetical protein